MPEVGSGGISFTGLAEPIACEMSSGYGTAPSAGTITFREQDQAPRNGNLTLDCDGERRTWWDCKLGTFQQQTDGSQSGFVNAQILDRRWRWQSGTISGQYNIKRARVGFQTGTEKSPRELATLLFKAMMETGADVSALPDESRPELTWDEANAANELASLCESLACRVILSRDDRARIVKLGTGRGLQDSPLAYGLGRALNTPDPPNKIRLAGAHIRHQCRLPLVAVGPDIGGVIRPIDNLSYKPPNGWEGETPDSLGGVIDKEIRQNDGSIVHTKQLASNVYRMYQVQKDGLEITDELKDVSRDRIILIPELVEKYIDELGVERYRPAIVAGVWVTATKPGGKNSKQDEPVVTYSPYTLITENIGFSIDPDRWLVQFSEPVWKFKADGKTAEPADIYLVCTVIVLDKETRAPKRFEKEITLGNAKGRSPVIETIRRDDVIQRIVTRYKTSGAIKDTEILDEDKLEKRADYYLNAQKTIYQAATQLELRQKGIQPVEVDGLVQQVTWSVDTNSGAETSASQGYEANRNVPSYDDMRQRQKRAAEALEPKPIPDAAGGFFGAW